MKRWQQIIKNEIDYSLSRKSANIRHRMKKRGKVRLRRMLAKDLQILQAFPWYDPPQYERMSNYE